MPNPVQRNQNISSQISNPPAFHQRHSGPIFRDTLLLHNSSIFGKIWDAIVSCVQSIFSCFSRSGSADKAKIQEIAARDHFLWFYNQQSNPLTAFMGNFYPCTIRLWGFQFQCAEAAFQAAKFLPDRAVMQRFARLDGDAAFRLGRNLSQNWTPAQHNQWRARNLNVMHEILGAKFSQNPPLKELLLATGNAYLVEHIPVRGRDAFWGDNHDGTGQNQLGIELMETRRNLGGGAPAARNSQYNAFLRR